MMGVIAIGSIFGLVAIAEGLRRWKARGTPSEGPHRHHYIGNAGAGYYMGGAGASTFGSGSGGGDVGGGAGCGGGDGGGGC
jgi:hypothetical protein